ncbi:MAG: 4'-phosphopantetheinyl transferase [Sulfurovum sp. PC08-66]|jgi:holo-[acyl-carrier protein] synthase|nr:MAG: 4'-phosphopantetheinyl transferase [Sulfurovum sp. PC08-66]
MKIGTDIVAIERIEKALKKFGTRYTQRFLNDSEIANLSQKPASIAGYWAAKEAIAKALGCGIGSELAFCDIEIYKDAKNAPHFRLSPKAQLLHAIQTSSLSISHDGGFAIAVVMIVQNR